MAESDFLDLSYFEKQIDELKDSVAYPYIEKRTKDDDLNYDLLEEVKLAFNEISSKEKIIQQVIQSMEFLIQGYTSLNDKYDEIKDKNAHLIEDNEYLRDDVLINMNSKLERNQEIIQEMEHHLLKSEDEIRELKQRLRVDRPENTVLKSMNAMEARVRRQSLLDTNGQIDVLQSSLNKYKTNCLQFENQVNKQSKQIKELKESNKDLEGKLQDSYDNYYRLQSDISELTKIKCALENEFEEAVDSRDVEINDLNKQISALKSEYEKLLSENKEMESKMQKMVMRSTGSPTTKVIKTGDRIETQASNDDEIFKKFDDMDVVESDSEPDDFFDHAGQY